MKLQPLQLCVTIKRMANSQFNRRDFLGRSACNAAGVAAGAIGLGVSSADSSSTIRLGIIGAGQQGQDLAKLFADRSDVELRVLCDVDVRHAAVLQDELNQKFGVRPILVGEHEAVLSRSDVDAVVIATPDHWHAPIAIAACAAGKHIYLEQPIALSIVAGAAIELAAREAGVVVQTGLPQRSGAHFQSAVAALQQGEIGLVHVAKAWAMHRRRSIGTSAVTAPPLGVDYSRWLGPAPQRGFQVNRFHQHWPWFWDYGAGELGMWGVQLLDVVRWGLDLDLPTRIVATGGIQHFQDDRETPDTLSVQYDFGDVAVHWEHRQWSSHGIEGRTAAAAFYGTEGTLIVDRSGWKIYDRKDSLYADASEIRRAHVDDFITAIREGRSPSADIGIGHRSMALCHLGNIACRLGRELRFDPASLHFSGDEAANALLAGETLSNPLPERL